MPQKKRIVRDWLPRRETAICARLRDARNYLRLSQTEFAEQVEITRERLASYEDARAPLKLGLALKICRQFVISEKWLAVGEERLPEFGRVPSRLCASLELEKSAKLLPEQAHFSAAFEQNLLTIYFECIEQTMPYPRIAIQPCDNVTMARNALNCLQDIGPAIVGVNKAATPENRTLEGRMLVALIKSAVMVCRELSALSGKSCEQETEFETFLARRWKEGFAKVPEDNFQSLLTAYSEKHTNESEMKPIPTLKEVLEAVRTATAERGQRAALARAFKISPASLSEWLRGESEPGGEITLRLWKWVINPKR